MKNVQLKLEKLANLKVMPEYATSGSAGLDLTYACDEPFTLAPGSRAKLPCGIKLEIPAGYEGQVRPRSGLAHKAGISLTNCVGTIDSDYRGEVCVLVINHGQVAYTFKPHERIAQLVIAPTYKVEILEIEKVDETDRGEGGFGSTGRSEVLASSEAG